MRRFFCIILLMIAASAAYSETVLLYIGNDAANDDTFTGCLPLASAVEDGVMSEFFDHGHIIFNAGIKPNYRFAEPPFKADRLPVRIAKAGGASLLLEVNLDFTGGKEEGNSAIKGATFVFSRLNSPKVLAKGEIEINSLPGVGEEGPEQSSYTLGTAIALQVLGTL